MSRGNRYCLKCVDRFTRWPEVFPIENIEAETVARAFVAGWVARFGTPLRVTTDQGRQFESHLFRQLNVLLGTTHLRTTAYHPAANGLVERFHRQLKAAIKCHGDERWSDALPVVLLGIRAAYRLDLEASAAELVYGENLRLPTEFFADSTRGDTEPVEMVRQLRAQFRDLRPVAGSRHGEKIVFVFKDVATVSHVFIRVDAVRGSLQNPYEGPFPVVSRTEKMYVVQFKGKNTTILIDRLKPAYLFENNDESTQMQVQTSLRTPQPGTNDATRTSAQEPVRTRSGRRVRFPSRLQVGG